MVGQPGVGRGTDRAGDGYQQQHQVNSFLATRGTLQRRTSMSIVMTTEIVESIDQGFHTLRKARWFRPSTSTGTTFEVRTESRPTATPPTATGVTPCAGAVAAWWSWVTWSASRRPTERNPVPTPEPNEQKIVSLRAASEENRRPTLRPHTADIAATPPTRPDRRRPTRH